MERKPLTSGNPFLVLLGVAQDGGVPHIGTRSFAWRNLSLRRRATCLGICDPESGERWIVEATPDIKEQLFLFDEVCSASDSASSPLSSAKGEMGGIFLTHAHVGHYLGLAFLGKEMLDVRGLPLYVMPRMRAFLSDNLPWRGLIERGNLLLRDLRSNVPSRLNHRIAVTPIPVPHRDEHSETVGFRIDGPNRSVLFIPDIDRWENWDAWGVRIEEHIAAVDVAYLDGTFFDERELPGRDMSQIPHPTVVQSMNRFASLPSKERGKIRFIHLNHSNPLLDPTSPQRAGVRENGFEVGEEMERIIL